ncbi:F0F1-type ATP synthase, alpha subunit [Terriglobus roseus DSM 18391]|uniref:ATP synthase subunit a n=1 Tax=Terriglobus roseus (strain DSM 18391 / NRRL B-41598 / KBS 63) TaxID=926566 RepID=I3ZF52_TERRK|nr:F0F1 ATP synthase subunit A [Terriglobus roseus]AFL87870.1 F0F1-type ATP synthase, alpha subunit [Terriglobus roseus DSM 18391]
MPEQLVFTRFLNAHFAGPVDALLRAVHVHPVYPDAPISNAVAMEVIVVALLLVYFVAVRTSLSVDRPNGVAHSAEMVHEFVSDQAESIVGHGYHKFVGYLSVLALFILVMNLLGLIPGLMSPTSNQVVPLGLALVTFIYYHYHGIRSNGAGYIKQFLGPVWWLAPLMFIIEVVSHLARVLSLTVRLYANMFAGDLVTLAFFSLIPVGVPLIFLGLHLGVSVIQTYVFMLLATIYLSLAVSHEH